MVHYATRAATPQNDKGDHGRGARRLAHADPGSLQVDEAPSQPEREAMIAMYMSTSRGATPS
jgi:hypothetical protein